MVKKLGKNQFDIIETLYINFERPFTLKEISGMANVKNSENFRKSIRTLVAQNYVQHLKRRKAYKLTQKGMNLAEKLGM